MSTTTPAPPADNRTTFLAFLASLEDGALAKDLTEQLRGLVGAMQQQSRDAGGKPVATLTLKVALKLDGGVFEVRAAVAAQPPKPIRLRSICYSTRDDLLSANNPRQLELGMEPRDVVTSSATALRVAK